LTCICNKTTEYYDTHRRKCILDCSKKVDPNSIGITDPNFDYFCMCESGYITNRTTGYCVNPCIDTKKIANAKGT
jgi:hypothetical protein